MIFDADNPYPLPHPHLRGAPHGARGPDRHPGGLSGDVREVGQNFAFAVLRDFYGVTQVVVENEAMWKAFKG